MPIELLETEPNFTAEANSLIALINRQEEQRLIAFRQAYREFWKIGQLDWDEARIQNVLRAIPSSSLAEMLTKAYAYGQFIKEQSGALWQPDDEKYLDTAYELTFNSGVVSVGQRRAAWQPLEGQ